jgi:hypothetical protein
MNHGDSMGLKLVGFQIIVEQTLGYSINRGLKNGSLGKGW